MKPTQIVARYDHSLVALSAAGELFGQVRGKWETIPGPEAEKITGIAVKPNGILVAVANSGRIYEQYRVGVHVGDFAMAWQPVPAFP
jgi:hypothetical protein